MRRPRRDSERSTPERYAMLIVLVPVAFGLGAVVWRAARHDVIPKWNATARQRVILYQADHKAIREAALNLMNSAASSECERRRQDLGKGTRFLGRARGSACDQPYERLGIRAAIRLYLLRRRRSRLRLNYFRAGRKTMGHERTHRRRVVLRQPERSPLTWCEQLTAKSAHDHAGRK